MADFDVYRILTKSGTGDHPYPTLKQDVHGNWYAGNQISTYELIGRLSRECGCDNRDKWLMKIYGIVQKNPELYGSYAGLNNWSPVYTDTQLKAFSTLCCGVSTLGCDPVPRS